MYPEDMKSRLENIDAVIARGPYAPNWQSLSDYHVPEWFRNARLGIFIHWGVYSVPAFGSEWYPRNMYIQGSKEYKHHIETYGPHKDFGYKDFIPMFKAEKFDPKAWAALFKKAGAQYVIPVAEHHDGFQMYASELSHWNAAEKGPCRNVLGELGEAVRAEGMVLGASTHRIEHWFFLGHGKQFDSDVKEPLKIGDLYWPSMEEPADHHNVTPPCAPTVQYMDDWLVRTCELIDRYQPMELYFDWWIQIEVMKPYLQRLAAYYYNRAAEWGKEVVIAYKHDAFAYGTAVIDIERGQFANPMPFLWQTDTAIAKNSWCYTENNEFKDPRDILCDFLDIISKNGRMLLNVGPKADGTISEEDTRVLTAIGEWMDRNKEGVIGTLPWKKYGEGPTQVTEGQFTDGVDRGFTKEDFRFMAEANHIYAFCLNFPDNGEITIRSMGLLDNHSKPEFAGTVDNVEVLGYPEASLEWTRTPDGMKIRVQGVSTRMPLGIRITVR